MSGNYLNLLLGFSHDIKFPVPKDVKVTLISSTEILLFSIDKALLGQVASDIRSYRKPDAYKGKGVRYADELIVTKEAKKK